MIKHLIAVITVAAIGGCASVAEQSEADRRIAAEQEIIKAYSDEVPKVDALLEEFLSAWKTANEKTDLKAYKEDIEANVLPALDRFVDAAGAMPLGSTQLKAIHAPLLSAYQDARTAHHEFVERVTVDNLDAEYAKVLDAMDKVSKAEEIYLESLEAYYQDNRVDLESAP